MTKKLLRILATLALLAMLAIPVVPAFGDAGDFSGDSDYDSGSSWDSGSDYDYDYGSSSSWDDDDDYYYSGSSDSSGGGSDDPELIDWVIVLAVILIILFFASMTSKQKGGSGKKSQAPVHIQDNFDKSRLQPLTTLMEKDPAFNPADVREKASNLYVQLQNTWTAKDLSPMRPYMTDTLFAQFDRQLDNYRQRQWTNRVDNITVLGVSISGWYPEAGKDFLVLEMNTRITDYTVEDQSGNVVKGNPAEEKFMTYRWTLERSSSAATGQQATRVTCPGCGAPLDINKTAQCPYCGSVVTVDEHGWVISAIQGLKQETR